MSSYAFQISSPNSDEATEICQLLISSIRELCEQDHQNDKAILDKWIANKTAGNVAQWIFSENTMLVCKLKDKIIGVIAMTPNGEILLNYVLPEYIRQGVASSMLSAIEEKAAQINLRELRCESTTTALDFYLKHGFTIASNSVKNKLGIQSYFMVKEL